MADQVLILPDDSGNTGKNLDSSQLTVSAKTVQRERHVIADDSTAAALAKVQNSAPGATDYGLTVRNIPSGNQNVIPTDGTNPITSTYDADTGVGTEFALGVLLRAPASGGSTNIDFNSGNKSAATIRVVLATDQPQLTNKILTTPDLPSGAATAAKQPALGTAGSASADVITVQGIASMTALKVDGSAVTQPVSFSTATSGGVSAFLNSALTNSAVAVKASAGQVYGWHIFNPSGAAAYVQIFNKAAAGVALGTDTPILSIGVQAGTQVPLYIGAGTPCSTAISCAATTTATGSTAPGTALVVNILYA